VAKNPHTVALGRRGGRRRAQVLSDEERREIARKAGEVSMENRSPAEREEFARLRGHTGGKRRAQALKPRRRAEIAKQAAEAR